VKTISCRQDLGEFGVVLLAGEACGLMCRLPCDMTERGRRGLATAFGVPGLRLAEPWNRGSADDPHVGSVLLPADMLTLVSVFALPECRLRRGLALQGRRRRLRAE